MASPQMVTCNYNKFEFIEWRIFETACGNSWSGSQMCDQRSVLSDYGWFNAVSLMLRLVQLVILRLND